MSKTVTVIEGDGVLVSLGIVDACSVATMAVGGLGLRGLSRKERESIVELFETLSTSGALDRSLRDSVSWWAAVRPSALVEAIEIGLRSDEAKNDPVEFAMKTDDERARMVESWERRLRRAASRMRKLWVR